MKLNLRLNKDIKTRFQEIAESKFNFKHKLTKFERMNLESSFDARILLYGKNKPRVRILFILFPFFNRIQN